jgi:phosphatidylglycerol:prolipoprotein diacylglycerol transferase
MFETLTAIPFPMISPVAVELGPLHIRWYALAYLAGILLGWRYAASITRRQAFRPSPEDIDDFMTWIVLGIILGGRIGYVLVYQTSLIWQDPIGILEMWHGGMSFHGGMTGLALAMFVFARRRGIRFLALTDVVGCVTPIGLFFGRIANFINGELWGRVTTVPWGMVFPGRAGPLPRHPSQLYEAGLEGIALLLILAALRRSPYVRDHHGILTGTFLIWYGCVRIVLEFFREPDVQMGFYLGIFTMGQILSLPMILLGGFLILYARRHPADIAEAPVPAVEPA